MTNKQKITPYLWFDAQAQEAAHFYTTIFPNARMGNIQYQGDKVLLVQFYLGDQEFTALNGGPMFSFNPSISFYVVCETEQEIEAIWEAMIAEGKALMPLDTYPWSKKYGWLQDKYGVSWQLILGEVAAVGNKISPTLMFTGEQHGKAEEAIQTYTSLFENSAVNQIARYAEGEGDPAVGTIKHAEFNLDGSIFMAMDSSHGHGFSFNEAISFVIHCQGQAEVDYFWDKLTADGGQEMMCAWLKDKFGVVWQVVPDELMQLIADPDPARAQRAVGAMMQMRKIEIDKLRAAADDEGRAVITVQTTIAAPKEKVWALWTTPAHITQWNFAADTWHCPKAENDLRVGGRFSYRMEAKDGSMGFDYAGTHSAVEEAKSLAFALDDGRTVQVHFSTVQDETFVMETFEADASQPIDMQQQGWQAILENFRKYVESN